MKKREQQKKQNIVAQGIGFFQDSWEELKKVHPPTREETIRGTIGVLVMVFFFGAFLGMTDYLIGSLVRQVLL